MTRTKEEPGGEELIPGKSIIVVSDLHLGLECKDCVSRDFLVFLDFLSGLKPKGDPDHHPAIQVQGKNRELYQPEKIILLGDIVDLWTPRNNSRTCVFLDSFPVIRKLLTLPCEKIYVTGNHDTEVNEVSGNYPGCHPPEITIASRHYPESVKSPDGQEKFTGLRAGKHHYYFLHGQQFDMLFILTSFLRDYPGWVANNCEVFKENPGLRWVFRGLFGASFLYILATWTGVMQQVSGPYASQINDFIYAVFGFSFVIFFISLDTGKFRTLIDFLQYRTKAKGMPIWGIVDTGFWKVEEGKNITADVVVFGHTHRADDSKSRYCSRPGKRFINSGSWEHQRVSKHHGTRKCEDPCYTFVYIDEAGPLLCRWVPDTTTTGHPAYFGNTTTGDHRGLEPQISALRKWLRQHLSKHG
jgi:predicted phosphodiesterase